MIHALPEKNENVIEGGSSSINRVGVTGTCADSIEHGEHRVSNSKQETEHTVLTTTKALIKTTNCTCRAKNGGAQKQHFFPALHVFPETTLKFVLAPLVTGARGPPPVGNLDTEKKLTRICSENEIINH